MYWESQKQLSVEKGIFEKFGEYPLNTAAMLMFHVQNGSQIFQIII